MTALPNAAQPSDPIRPSESPGGDAAQPTEGHTSSPNGTSQPVHVDDQGELHLDPLVPLSADQIVFVAEIRSLLKRVVRNRFWARQEICLLCENAANAGIVAGDITKGELILARATEIYQKALLGRNRIQYVVGTFLGVLVLIVLALIVVELSVLGIVPSLAPPETLISLFAFAGIGSVTSVLIRLSTLELNEETSKTLLMLSGASKPLVAIAFASIVYILLKNNLVAVTIGSSDSSNPDAAYWVAAFLCGFSERFGSDIIARLEPKSDPGPEN